MTHLISVTLISSASLVSFTACMTAREEPPAAPTESAPEPPPRPVVTEQPTDSKTCTGTTRPAQDGLIDDLEDGDVRSAPLGGRTGSWWIAKADHAVVTTPGVAFASSDGGAGGSKKAARFAGKTDNRDQWGAAVGVNFLESGGFYDASKYAGIAFKIKASQPNMNVRVKVPDVSSIPEGGLCGTSCWNSFGKELLVGTEWKDEVILWSDLSQQAGWGNPRPPAVNVAKLKDIEWTVYQGVEFDIAVDDVRFVECG